LALFFMQMEVQADIYWYDVVKEDFYSQTSNSSPTSPYAHRVQSRIFFDQSGDLTQAQTTYGGSQSPINYDVIDSAGTAIYYSPTYINSTQRDADFPSGAAYSFSVSGGTLGNATASLQTGSLQLFSSTIPYFNGNTFDRLQNLAPNSSFLFTFNAHAVNPNAANSVNFLQIWDLDSNTRAFLTNFAPTTTSYLLPAGTLQGGRNYLAQIFFNNRRFTSNAGFNGATAVDDYQMATVAQFTAIPEPGATVSLITLSIGMVMRRVRKFKV
jgi:hypothetical protein